MLILFLHGVIPHHHHDFHSSIHHLEKQQTPDCCKGHGETAPIKSYCQHEHGHEVPVLVHFSGMFSGKKDQFIRLMPAQLAIHNGLTSLVCPETGVHPVCVPVAVIAPSPPPLSGYALRGPPLRA